jgi:hypothetical protein
MAPGGTIVLDDIDWEGVRNAADFLQTRFEKIGEFRGDKFAYAAFRVPQRGGGGRGIAPIHDAPPDEKG